jgi:hypothetical protein
MSAAVTALRRNPRPGAWARAAIYLAIAKTSEFPVEVGLNPVHAAGQLLLLAVIATSANANISSG